MNIDQLIRELPDRDLLSAWDVATAEVKKRFPHLAYTPTAEELADPESLAKRLAEQQSAFMAAKGMKAS